MYSAVHIHRKEDIKHGKAKKIEVSDTYYGKDGPDKGEYTQYLNQNNLVIREESIKNNKLFFRSKLQIDSITGLVASRTVEIWHPVKGYSLEKTIYHYDKLGFFRGTTFYNASGKRESEVVINVNEKGFPIELANYDDKGNLLGGYETADYLYDQNRYIRTLLTHDGREVAKDTTVIDFEEEYKFHNPGREYNQQGNIIRSHVTDNKYTLYEYKYDSKQNWTEQKQYELIIQKNGKEKRKLQYLRTRKIEYWDE
ncbi:hypothetical protein QNI16_18850 [Cytophagaceae bacterium YF14B1]|uniref:Uncharacterized protein n=1 Tax=Xanthocytophaga flava TaxID=3048013 RepID=A0AAE3QS93_9BACT|nr:hypothetical protein [Xanthocytophaga flavus]MDJ1482570.1 hypothetical protein [Xanthocytophaga flavus]